MSLGPMEVILIIAVILIFFGPKRLPGLGKALGEGIRSFKDGLTSSTEKDKLEGSSKDNVVDTSARKVDKES